MTFLEAVTHPSFVLGTKWAKPVESEDVDDLLQCSAEGFIVGVKCDAPLIAVDAIAEKWELIFPEEAPPA